MKNRTGDSAEIRPERSQTSAPVWTFVIAGLLCGFLYSVVVPPFHAPDEKSHFLRTWYVSEGHLGAIRSSGAVGVMVPPEVKELGSRFGGRVTCDPDAIHAALHAPPVSRDRVFAENALHAWASPVVYVPQAVGIAVGRAVDVSPLACLYLGRFANVIAGVLLIGLAIAIFPSYRWLVALMALTPMANHLRGSLSLDSVTMGAGFLFLALVARLWFFERGEVPWRTWIAITILAGLVCLTRTTYAPVAALPLFIPSGRFRRVWSARLILALAIVLALSSAFMTAARNWTPFRPGISDPQGQFQFILSHPMAFAKVLWLEHVIHAKWYLISMVGDLGSGASVVPLPKLLVVIYFLAIVFLLISDTNEQVVIKAKERALLALVCVASTLAIALAIYTSWNPVGWTVIDGLQGRYYLPFVPAAFFVVHRARRGVSQRVRMFVVAGVVCLSTVIALDRAVNVWYPRGWSGWRNAYCGRTGAFPVLR